jgi:hypothetical protein
MGILRNAYKILITKRGGDDLKDLNIDGTTITLR